MTTQLLSTSEQDLKTAAAIIQAGGLVAIPTETVYGLGADGLNPDAVKKIFLAKGAPGQSADSAHPRRQPAQ